MSGEDFYTFQSCKCHSPWCPDCQRGYGWILRNALGAKADIFQDVAMLTLTIDPKNFSSPLEAFWSVTRGFGKGKVSAIAELLRSFHIKNWMKVLEFQRNEFPHWHILLDVSDCPECWILPDGTKVVAPRLGNSDRWNKWAMERFLTKISVPGARLFCLHYLDMEAVRRKWENWGFGKQVNIRTMPRQKGKCGFKYALNYITKYIMKPNKNPIPSWVLSNSRIRRFSCSASIGRILMKSGGAVAGDSSSVPRSAFDDVRFQEILNEERNRVWRESDFVEYCRFGSKFLESEKSKFGCIVEVRARDAALAKYMRERLDGVLYRSDEQKRREYRRARPIGVKISACGLSTIVRNGEGEFVCKVGLSVRDLDGFLALESQSVSSSVHGFFERKLLRLDSDLGRKFDALLKSPHFEVISQFREIQSERVRDGMLSRAERFNCLSLARHWVTNVGNGLLRSLAI